MRLKQQSIEVIYRMVEITLISNTSFYIVCSTTDSQVAAFDTTKKVLLEIALNGVDYQFHSLFGTYTTFLFLF